MRIIKELMAYQIFPITMKESAYIYTWSGKAEQKYLDILQSEILFYTKNIY